MKLHEENGENREQEMRGAGKSDGQRLHLHTTYLPRELVTSDRSLNQGFNNFGLCQKATHKTSQQATQEHTSHRPASFTEAQE